MHGFITLSEATSYDKIIAYKAKKKYNVFHVSALVFPISALNKLDISTVSEIILFDSNIHFTRIFTIKCLGLVQKPRQGWQTRNPHFLGGLMQ